MAHAFADVYRFSDFRIFLAEYLEARRKREKSFTQAHVCRKLGLPNSRSYLSDVIRGSKPLTPSKTTAMIAALELSDKEARYFRTLVLYNQAILTSEKDYYLERLLAMNRSPASILRKQTFEYYRTWYHSAVRALLDVVDVKDDPSVLAKSIYPPLSAAKAAKSLALLKKLGLIRKNEDGYWKPSEKLIHSGAYAQDDIVKRYQIAGLEIAKVALWNQKAKAQNFSTETLSISENGYRAIEQRLQEFKSEIRTLVHQDESWADRVYQLNIQLFPQSI
jgi:uncharacterized protein (TIGR02147 family)